MTVRLLRRALGASCWFAWVSLLPASAWACSVCGCGDPLVQAGDSAPQPGALRLSLDAEYLDASAASDDDPSATESLTQLTLRPTVVYSPVAALNLVLQIPFERKAWSLRGPDGTEAASPTGLGDLDLGARWFVFQHTSLASRSRTELATTFGTSLPTGSTSAASDDGERIDDHAQLGTGSFGPYAGLLVAHHTAAWTWTGSISGRAHSTNSYDYHYGGALLWSASGQYLFTPHLALGLGALGRYAQKDRAGDELLANTGGFVLSAQPTVSYGVSDAWWLNLRAQVPVATHLFGEQHVGPVVTLGVQYSPN